MSELHHLEIQDMWVLRGLEIYDGTKILNCDLYFVIVGGVSQQQSHLSVGDVQLSNILGPLFATGAQTILQICCL